MSLKDLQLKQEYRSPRDDVIHSFYVPTLRSAVLYQRAVGFFSSAALMDVSIGVSGLLSNGGRMELIVSPKLSEDDLAAIQAGYDAREIIERSILLTFVEPTGYFQSQRLNLLATLIAEKHLDIKVAFTRDANSVGIYHEKLGLIRDSAGNVVVFTGSMNESAVAFSHNYEAVDVFRSWIPEDQLRVQLKEAAFDALWHGRDEHAIVLEFPTAAKTKLLGYATPQLDQLIDQKQFPDRQEHSVGARPAPRVPSDLILFDYQNAAIQCWEENGHTGIFDMATGTGKTFTALAATARVFQTASRLAVLIACPYQHLVDQWADDIRSFGMKPIIGHSASAQKDWKARLKDAVSAFNIGAISHFCFVGTNATFVTRYVDELFDTVVGPVVLVVDEAHNVGAPKFRSLLKDNYPYRIALSATLERYNDTEGTDQLFAYFGDKCIDYPLDRAITEGKLTPYWYQPVVVSLSSGELAEYKRLTKRLRPLIASRPRTGELTLSAKMLLLKRARLVAGATEKLNALYSLMEEYKEQRHILVYCGTASMDADDFGVDEEEIRQVDAVASLLGNDLGMRVSKFTAEESAGERRLLQEAFAAGDIQALVAIKCLDEGVNIPAVHTAFILASSTNPREYVQRRGRILRTAPGKSRALLYDFVTFPRPLGDVPGVPDEEIRGDLPLVNREIARVREFGSLAQNPSAADALLQEVDNVYRLSFIGKGEYPNDG